MVCTLKCQHIQKAYYRFGIKSRKILFLLLKLYCSDNRGQESCTQHKKKAQNNGSCTGWEMKYIINLTKYIKSSTAKLFNIRIKHAKFLKEIIFFTNMKLIILIFLSIQDRNDFKAKRVTIM